MFEINPSSLGFESSPERESIVAELLNNASREPRSQEHIAFEQFRWLSWDAVYHDTERTFEFIRNGAVVEEWTQRHQHHDVCSCQFALWIRERELNMSDDVRLSGNLQNMSYEDFQKYFNMPLENRVEHRDEIEGTLKELLRYLFCEDKITVAELRRMALEGTSNEKEQAYKILADRIHINETARNILSVWIHKDRSIQYDIVEDANEENRKKLREHDKKYKPKPQPKPEDTGKAKLTKTKDEKMRQTLMSLAPSEMKAKGKEKELNDWIDKMIVQGRSGK